MPVLASWFAQATTGALAGRPDCADAATKITSIHASVRKAASCDGVRGPGQSLARLESCLLSEPDRLKLEDAKLDWNIKRVTLNCGKAVRVDCSKLSGALEKPAQDKCAALWHDRAELGRLRVCANSKKEQERISNKRKELEDAIARLDASAKTRCKPPPKIAEPERLAGDQVRTWAEARLRDATAAVEEAIKTGKTDVFDLRRTQLEALAPYADLIVSLELPAPELQKAIETIPWLGANLAVVAALAKERPEVLTFAARVVSAKPEDRETMLKTIKRLDPELAAVLDKHWNGDKDALAQALKLVQKRTKEELDRLSDESGQVGNETQRMREHMLRMRAQRALYVLMEAPHAAECTAAKLFVDEASGRLSKREEVQLLLKDLPSGALRDQAKRVRDAMLENCGNKDPPRGKVGPACGALLEVSVLPEGAEYRVEAKLTFVLPPDVLSRSANEQAPTRLHSEPRPFSIPAFDAACNSSGGRDKAVQALLDEVAARYSRFGSGMILEKEVPACVARTCHCGVRVNADPVPGARPPAIPAGLRFIGSCGPPAFVATVKDGLRHASNLVGQIVDEKNGSGVPQLLFSISGGDCTANLSVNQTPAWSAKAFVDTKAPCGRAPEEIWSSAGQDVADQLLTFYRSKLPIELGGPPPPPPDPGWAHASQALVLAGLPWLTDGLQTKGDGWALAASIADAVLLASSVAAIAYSTHLREQYATLDTESRSGYDTFRTVGIVLGGTVVVGRLVSFFLYGGSDINMQF